MVDLGDTGLRGVPHPRGRGMLKYYIPSTLLNFAVQLFYTDTRSSDNVGPVESFSGVDVGEFKIRVRS